MLRFGAAALVVMMALPARAAAAAMSMARS